MSHYISPIAGPSWRPLTPEEVRARPPVDQDARARGPRPAPSALVVRGIADSSLGYGKMAGQLARALESHGLPIAFDPVLVGRSRLALDPFVDSRLVEPGHGRPVLQMYPSDVPLTPGSIMLAMFESTRPPASWLPGINSCAAFVVPCAANRDWFSDLGVTVPIRIVPLGIDPAIYHPAGPEPEGRFVVKCSGKTGHGGERKGLDDCVSVFLEALGDRPDCSLEVKIWPECTVADPGHPRVTLDRRSLSESEMAQWYRDGSVYLSLSRGEGWGLGAHESLACGRPVVAPFHSGFADYLTPDCAYPVEYDAEPGGGIHYTGAGDWFRYRRASAVEQLRRAYLDAPGRRAMGEAAARRALEFTWSRSGRDLARVVREFGLAPNPAPAPSVDPALRDAVNSCPDRGGELPVSAYLLEGCCAGPTRYECRAGRGRHRGQPTLRECLDCRSRRPDRVSGK